MIIAALVKRYEQQLKARKVVGLGWSVAEVSFALRLYESGEIADVIDQRIEVEINKKNRLKPTKMAVPEQERRSGKNYSSSFLCENANYFFGIDDNTEQFEAAKKLHLEILKDCDSATARAIKNFFANWNPSDTATHPKLQEYFKDLQKGARLVFMFEENFATEDDEIRAAWENYRQSQDESVSMQCLITGKILPVATIHPLIKGVRNANTSGGSIVSFNESAFESYGHDDERGLNAPISKYAAFAYTTALNDLLADKDHVKFFGDTTIVYWAEENSDECQELLDDLFSPDENKISDETLDKIMEGIKTKNISLNGTNLNYDNPFYVLGLSPNNARLSVRLFLQNSFGEVIENIAKHYEDFRIAKPLNATDYIPLWRILKATTSSKSKETTSSPLMTGAVVKAIMSGQNYPVSLLQNVILRIRAEHAVSYEKAAIIKAYLTRNKGREHLMALDENSTDVSYVYGRIFSVLEKIQMEVQMEASSTLNATIKDKYFTSACATPTKVFPILLKLSVHHLNKLKTGRRIYWEKQLTNLMGKLSPSAKNSSTLTLEEQGMFILGYYHQTQERYKKKENKENE